MVPHDLLAQPPGTELPIDPGADALAARYGVLVTADGKTVWAELAATA